MPTVKHWNVDIAIAEYDTDRRTDASAVLTTGEGPSRHADGTALRHADDADISAIGDELAVGRALAELGRQLLAQADADLDRPPA